MHKVENTLYPKGAEDEKLKYGFHDKCILTSLLFVVFFYSSRRFVKNNF